MSRLFLVSLIVCGCAKAGPVDLVVLTDANGFGGRDGDNGEPIDAPLRDAPILVDAGGIPVSITLQQTVSNNIVSQDTITCNNVDGSLDNTWYRAFMPSEQGVTNAFHITQVTFGVEESTDNLPVTVAVGTYSGAIGGTTLDPTKFTQLASVPFTVPASGNGELVPVPITADIPAGMALAARISAADFTGTGDILYFGCTTSGETHPGYISSNACNTPTPTSPGALGQGGSELILTVTGTHLQ